MIKKGTLIFLVFVSFQVSCAGQKTRNKVKAFPFGTWMRSQEEDKDPNSDWKLYRPESYPFPAARGRNGIICKANGQFAVLMPSMVDGKDTVWGNWELVSSNSYKIKLPKGNLSSFKWRILKKGIVEIHLE